VAHALNGFAEARVHDMHNCFIASMNEKHDVAMAAHIWAPGPKRCTSHEQSATSVCTAAAKAVATKQRSEQRDK